MEETHIYTLTDPITNEVRYVGKSNNVNARYQAHMNEGRNHQVHKSNWISKLKKTGHKPIMCIIDTVPVSEWRFWERYWISQMKAWGFSLINYTAGGDGCAFGNQTSFKLGQGGKPVIAYDSKYNCIHEFESSSAASKHFNLNRGSISSICSKNNRRKTSKGLAWFYKKDIELLNDEDIKVIIDERFTKGWKANSGSYVKGNLGTRSKKVCMFDLDWEFIRTFESAKKAGEFVNVTGGAIQFACLVSKKSICKKYKWKYEEDIDFGTYEVG